MAYDKALIAGKLRRWDKYLISYRLPTWEEIPDIGLYMEQVILLLKQYLDYLPPDIKEEQYITAAAINNYVRTKIMPEPVKKRYYRVHMAYMIIIFTLKQSLSIATVKNIIPMDISEDEVKEIYSNFALRQKLSSEYLREQIRLSAGKILDHNPDESSILTSEDTGDIVISSAIIGGLLRIFAEKLLLLKDLDLESGGAIEPLDNTDK